MELTVTATPDADAEFSIPLDDVLAMEGSFRTMYALGVVNEGPTDASSFVIGDLTEIERRDDGVVIIRT